ncbi:MAG: hypothetical protein HGA63_06965, partial [Syntrophobacteraceae bacterium]|nr:hypothetical protein [Syntrophobacteraceae bacterium]
MVQEHQYFGAWCIPDLDECGAVGLPFDRECGADRVKPRRDPVRCLYRVENDRQRCAGRVQVGIDQDVGTALIRPVGVEDTHRFLVVEVARPSDDFARAVNT